MTAYDTRARIAKAVANAACSYDSMSGNMGTWWTPESWLQCAIPPVLNDDYYVILEAPATKLLDWHFENSRRDRSLERSLEGKRIDIALCAPKGNADEAHTVGLIEVKKCTGDHDCIDDAGRLKELSVRITTVRTALIVAHVQDGSQAELDARVTRVLKAIDVPPSLANCEKFPNRGSYCACVVAELMNP